MLLTQPLKLLPYSPGKLGRISITRDVTRLESAISNRILKDDKVEASLLTKKKKKEKKTVEKRSWSHQLL